MAVRIAPSILSAPFTAIGEAVQTIEDSDGDWIHLDVMDGSFVPPITFGSQMVADINELTSLPLDVHLMIDAPERHIETFASSGADYLTVHYEVSVHLHRLLQNIRALGVKPGVSIVPSTPADSLSEVLGEIDLLLVMSVNPGYGGQSLIPATLDKVRRLVRMREEGGYNFLISIDGGINRDTAATVRASGVDVMVSGSAFFKAENPKEEVQFLRGV